MQEKKEIVRISDKELSELKKSWKEDRILHENAARKNRDLYFENRESMFEKYNGKYIAFANGDVLYVSDSLNDVEKFVLMIQQFSSHK